ncbi:MAG: propanediol utilization protein [Rhodobacteraceae bacterium]|nr:propanediol utilization protein [Paracoccaceae bacterium]
MTHSTPDRSSARDPGSPAAACTASTFVAGHFGEWFQGRAGPQGGIVLVTLHCRNVGVRAERQGEGPLALEQRPALLGIDRAAGFLAAAGLPVAGSFRLRPDLPPGSGAGMSTAALVALARAASPSAPVSDDRLAAACLAAEGASDPLWLPAPDALLWAPREARTVRAMPPPPLAEIVGGLWGPPQRTDPADRRFPSVDDLVAAWAAAPDLAGAARIAAESAARTTALRGPAGDPTAALAARLGALGHARAHTGSARALIFAPGAVPEGAEAALRSAGYTHVLRFRTGGRR